MDIDDALIDALVEIANHKKVITVCEPNVMQPLKIERWMILRVLKAQQLFQEEYKEGKRNESR